MSKSTFYLLLIGRLSAGAIIMWGSISFAEGRPLPQLVLVSILAFGLVMTLFWAPPFTFTQYAKALKGHGASAEDDEHAADAEQPGNKK